LSELQSLIELEELELNHYRTSHPNEGWENVFGGQVLAQATWAASRTIIDNRVCHSLHGYFLRPGKKDKPILYKVDRIRDGKSFTTRRVVAIQKGQAIFNMSISFQVYEEGLEHQFTAPKSPTPAALDEKKSSTTTQGSLDQMEAIDSPNLPASIDVLNIEERKEKVSEKMPRQKSWMRCRHTLPDEAIYHQCAMAYLSDWSLLDTSFIHRDLDYSSGDYQIASLDHAMWFHHSMCATDWHLFEQESPNGSGARGYNRGLIYNEEGKLIASTMQEGLIRKR